MQLVLESRNFEFFFKTGKALGDKGFMNRLLGCYQREGAAKLLDPRGQEKDLMQLVDICGSDIKLTIFNFIQADWYQISGANFIFFTTFYIELFINQINYRLCSLFIFRIFCMALPKIDNRIFYRFFYR
jgi:hypothetical protein